MTSRNFPPGGQEATFEPGLDFQTRQLLPACRVCNDYTHCHSKMARPHKRSAATLPPPQLRAEYSVPPFASHVAGSAQVRSDTYRCTSFCFEILQISLSSSCFFLDAVSTYLFRHPLLVHISVSNVAKVNLRLLSPSIFVFFFSHRVQIQLLHFSEASTFPPLC